jgi:hypothetical protein
MRAVLFAIASLAFAADPKESLVFHANFDKSTDAVKASGDAKLYSAPSYKELSAAKPGLAGTDVSLAPGKGRKGGALYFAKKNTTAVFYKAAGNLSDNASGTISFWLNLSPETGLAPDYCDPLQLTGFAYNDSAIWVDFTKDEKPRHFRLGVFGKKAEWSKGTEGPAQNELFTKRLVVEKQHPFQKGQWTHIAITYLGLGTANGQASLYLNGKLIGQSPTIPESFSWEGATLRLGVNYTGYFDDLAVYSRPLSELEIEGLSKGKF